MCRTAKTETGILQSGGCFLDFESYADEESLQRYGTWCKTNRNLKRKALAGFKVKN